MEVRGAVGRAGRRPLVTVRGDEVVGRGDGIRTKAVVRADRLVLLLKLSGVVLDLGDVVDSCSRRTGQKDS